MSVLQNLQSFFYRRALRNRLEQKTRATKRKRAVNIATAKQIGILFDATELSEREAVLAYAKKLKKDQKKVSLLGYFRTDVGEADFPFPYFSKKEISWSGYPKGTEMEHFLEKEFDLLFFLRSMTNPIAEYIVTSANAGMKIGPLSDRPDTYDLMIDTDSAASTKQFIGQVEFILQKTNVPQLA